MASIELKARAKINLSLDIVAKRPDGYHDVKMIMQTIELHDKVFLEETDGAVEVECNSRWVPSGNENIAFKAAELLRSRCGLTKGVKIKIIKKIPVAAGLAGGSTDAAAVLKGMNELFSLGLEESELMAAGKQVGADVPYCVKGGTMLAEGIGELLTELHPLPRTCILLVKPRIGVSTAWVYKNLELEKIIDRPDTDMLIRAIADRRVDILAGNMKNVLETVTAKKHDVIREIKQRLLELGAAGSMMSGSGPSVFGIFADRKAAETAFEAMKSGRWDCFLTETICEER